MLTQGPTVMGGVCDATETRTTSTMGRSRVKMGWPGVAGRSRDLVSKSLSTSSVEGALAGRQYPVQSARDCLWAATIGDEDVDPGVESRPRRLARGMPVYQGKAARCLLLAKTMTSVALYRRCQVCSRSRVARAKPIDDGVQERKRRCRKPVWCTYSWCLLQDRPHESSSWDCCSGSDDISPHDCRSPIHTLTSPRRQHSRVASGNIGFWHRASAKTTALQRRSPLPSDTAYFLSRTV